jgi:hypothetical protein
VTIKHVVGRSRRELKLNLVLALDRVLGWIGCLWGPHISCDYLVL